MADEAARRRELRRKKILENAEERKKKIFGTTNPSSLNNANGPQKLEEPPGIPEACVPPVQPVTSPASASPTTPSSSPISSQPQESITSSPVFTHTDLGQTRLPSGLGTQNGSVPDLAEQLINLNMLLSANGNLGAGGVQAGGLQGFSGQGDITHHTAPVKPLKSSLLPIVIALLVCVLLSYNLGYVVSNSISIPFLLWEIHHLWSRRESIIVSSSKTSGLINMALMLCGIKQVTVSSVYLLYTIGKCFLEDFALYIFTVILWHNIIGLPMQVAESIETSQPNMPKEDPFEDIDGELLDF